MIKPELTEGVDLEPGQDGLRDLLSGWDERIDPVDEPSQAEAVAAFDGPDTTTHQSA